MAGLPSPSMAFSLIHAPVLAIVTGKGYEPLHDMMPTHWNSFRQADSWGEKLYAVDIPQGHRMRSVCCVDTICARNRGRGR